MAVNVNTVYKTVLLILNKEQRGYMTPEEFNKAGAQAQIEIFNKYFDDLNQLLRSTQADLDYADRVALLDEKIAIFKTNGAASGIGSGVFSLPNNLRELGSVIYNNKEVQRLQRIEFYNINNSEYTKPSENYPVYLYENNLIKVYPTTITTNVLVNYIRKLVDPIWGFSVGSRGQYVYQPALYNSVSNPSGSLDFELHESEQSNIITRILMYAGVIIQSPEIIQVASQQVQAEQINSKA